MYTLIGAPITRTIRVAWMLEELGQPYSWEPAKPHSERVISLAGGPKVPLLLVEDTVLTDSTAILTFLADRHAALTHAPGTVERAVQDGLTHFILDEMDSILWMATKHRYILPEEARVADIQAACATEFALAETRLAARLGDGPFLMGQMFTLPDIIAGHCLGWAKGPIGFGITEPALQDYATRVRARPAYRAAVAKGKALTEA